MIAQDKTHKPRHTIPSAFRGKVIRAMPYEIRLRGYEKDKQALFLRMAKMTPAEVRDAQQALVRKWMV